MKKNKNRLKGFIFILLPVLAFFLSMSLLIIGVKLYLENASYFNIKKVVVNGLENEGLAQRISKKFLYENIFSLDLKSNKEDLKIANPQFYDVRLIRNLPGQITINVLVRRPIAQIEHKGFFLLDSEGVIVSNKSNSNFSNKFILYGLKNIPDLSFGKKINQKELKASLRLVDVLENVLPKIALLIPTSFCEKVEIDISQYPSLYVYFGGKRGMEVRFYDNNFDKEVRLFMQLLPSINNKIDQVEYIDLRFKEPAVSFKR